MEIKTFSRTMIKSIHDAKHIYIRNGNEITRLWNILADKSIHVFIRTSFPGSIRVSKIKICLQFLRDLLMVGKLLAVICCDGVQKVRNRLQKVINSPSHLVSRALLHFAQQGKTSLSLCQSDNGLTMPFASCQDQW